MKVFDKIVKGLETAIKVLVSAFVLILSILTFFQVIMRYVFRTGLTWNDEFCRTMFVFIIFLILPYASLHNMHMQLDVVSGKIEKSKPFLRIIAWIAELAFFVMVARFGYLYALANMKKIAPSLQIPYYYIYIIIPIGCVLGVIFLIYRAAKVLEARAKGASWADAITGCLQDGSSEQKED